MSFLIAFIHGFLIGAVWGIIITSILDNYAKKNKN